MASFILRQVDNAIAKAKDAAKEAERAQHQADIDELVTQTKMMKPHAKTFKRAWQALIEGGTGDAGECPFCMERYDDDSGRVPRILTACGHTACEGCYASMLRLAPLDKHGHGKEFACPTCRQVTIVKGGSAANLPKNFAALR